MEFFWYRNVRLSEWNKIGASQALPWQCENMDFLTSLQMVAGGCSIGEIGSKEVFGAAPKILLAIHFGPCGLNNRQLLSNCETARVRCRNCSCTLLKLLVSPNGLCFQLVSQYFTTARWLVSKYLQTSQHFSRNQSNHRLLVQHPLYDEFPLGTASSLQQTCISFPKPV